MVPHSLPPAALDLRVGQRWGENKINRQNQIDKGISSTKESEVQEGEEKKKHTYRCL